MFNFLTLKNIVKVYITLFKFNRPHITQAIAKAIGCFPQNDGKSLFLKTIATYLIEHKRSQRGA